MTFFFRHVTEHVLTDLLRHRRAGRIAGCGRSECCATSLAKPPRWREEYKWRDGVWMFASFTIHTCRNVFFFATFPISGSLCLLSSIHLCLCVEENSGCLISSSFSATSYCCSIKGAHFKQNPLQTCSYHPLSVTTYHVQRLWHECAFCWNSFLDFKRWLTSTVPTPKNSFSWCFQRNGYASRFFLLTYLWPDDGWGGRCVSVFCKSQCDTTLNSPAFQPNEWLL